jgi:hypothetical protein
MEHACDHKLGWRLRSGGSWIHASLVKKFVILNLNGKKLNVVACTCHPNQGGKVKIGGSQSRWA